MLAPSKFTGSRKKDYWIHKNGGLTHRDMLRRDIDEAISKTREGLLTKAVIQSVMSEEKANQREMFKLPMESIRQYAPKANRKQLEDFVLKACEHYRKYLIRQRNRDER